MSTRGLDAPVLPRPILASRALENETDLHQRNVRSGRAVAFYIVVRYIIRAAAYAEPWRTS